MSDKISELPVATTPLNLADLLVLVQGGVTKRSTVGDIPGADVITNDNGTAVRWDSGLQIAYRDLSDTVAMTTAAAGGFRSASVSATLAAAFTSTAFQVVATATINDALVLFANPGGSGSSVDIRWWRATTNASVVVAARIIAIGLWK